MKVGVVLGTRPEIIKMSPVVRELQDRAADYFVLHTGQHYSHNMDAVFFEELGLPQPEYNLAVGSGTHGEQTGKMIPGIELVLMEEGPDVVLVEGDTNTVLAGALAACKLGIKVAHVEAGLRSFDRSMPEEVNRVVADHVSSLLFAPTSTSRRNLLSEGIPPDKVVVTGNTIVDVVARYLEIARGRARPVEGDYLLTTLHRQENTDDAARLSEIVRGLNLVGETLRTEIVFPVHPRTQSRVKREGIRLNGWLKTIEPVGFLDFLNLEAGAKLILTDSGGVQEEACILGVPCVTLRDNTERPETVAVGANKVAGVTHAGIVDGARCMIQAKGWPNPLGDGAASRRIIQSLATA